MLIVRSQKQTMVPLTKPVMTIGRRQADIILDDAKVSSLHAEIRAEGNQIFLVDLQSTNGTFVNRQPISRTALSDQDVVEIGNTTLCFYADTREYNGPQDEISTGKRSGAEKTGRTVAGADSITTTQTLQQIAVYLKILDGPNSGKTFKFKKSHITIGRNDADVVLLDADVSRAHALIEVFGRNAIFLRDMGSTNGTYIKGRKIQSEKLASGDEILLGNSKLLISFEGALE